MVKTKRHYTAKEAARRGRALYARKIRAKVARQPKGRVVAIDIYSGDFEVADDTLSAADALRARRPDAEVWLERVGFPTFLRFGAWKRKRSAE